MSAAEELTEVRSPTQGVVVAVPRTVGDPVREGQALAVLESM